MIALWWLLLRPRLLLTLLLVGAGIALLVGIPVLDLFADFVPADWSNLVPTDWSNWL